MGFCGDCHCRLSATACAHSTHFICRGCDAIFREEISPRADARPNCPILHPGVLGSPLWTASAHGHFATRGPGPNCSYRTDGRRDRSSNFHSRKETQETATKLANFDNRLRFAVNLDMILRAKLNISTKLISLARILHA